MVGRCIGRCTYRIFLNVSIYVNFFKRNHSWIRVHAGGSALLQKQQRRGRGVCLSVELGTEHDVPPAPRRPARHASCRWGLLNFLKRNHSWIQSVLRARRRQRLASETAAERERRLSQRRARDRARRAARSSPTSETRLVQMGSVERLYLQHGENYLNLSAFDDVLRDIVMLRHYTT